jgi:uncharacterized alpha-E superfamily protein
MGCFAQQIHGRADGMLTLNTLYIMSFDQETNDYQGYKPLLENYTNLSPEVILEVQHNTFVLNHIICEATNTSSVKCLISKARENARGSQDKITKELWSILTLCIILLMTQSCLKTSNIRKF